MCLAMPGKVVSVDGEDVVVDYEGKKRTAKVLEECKVGDYVIVSGGFIVERVEEDVALKALETIKGIVDGEC